MNEKILDRIPDAVFITSRSNPLVVSLAKLEQAKHRREQRLFLAEGIKLSAEAASCDAVRYVLLRSDDGFADSDVISIAASAKSGAVIVLPGSVFEKISTENAPQGIITVLQFMPEMHFVWSAEYAGKLDDCRLLAVDSVQDPGNLGTIIRTACAFGYRHILLGGCADLYHPKTVRASMGTLFRMHIYSTENLSDALRNMQKRGHRVLSAALADNAMTLGKNVLLPHDCVVIGNEGHGISREILDLSDARIRIPMTEDAESLNAAGAAAVLMWEYYRSFH